MLRLTALAAALLLAQLACAQAREAPAASSANGAAASPDNAAAQPSATPDATALPSPADAAQQEVPAGVNRERLKAQAEELTRAFERRDYAAAVDLTHTKVAELAGGRAAMIAFLEKSMKEMEGEGLKIESFTVGEPRDFVGVGRRVFAVLPTTMKATFGKQAVTSEGNWVAVSEDRGENWTFVNLERGAERERVRTLFPEAADKLRLPQTGPPEIRKVP
jgi:hypothetical protein